MPNRTFSRRGLSGPAAFCIVFFAFSLCLPSYLAASDALVKAEVSVDVVGKDAVDARSRAMTSAESEGLKQLLERFTSSQQAQAIIASLPVSRISGMVRGMEVISERISDRRYRAQLQVAFDGGEINKLITAAAPDGSTVIDAPSASAFGIVPVYQEGSRTMLWEAENPWLSTWKTHGLENSSEGIVVPYGDNGDGAAISPKNAASATFSDLTSLTSRYGIGQVVILQARFEATPEMVLTVVKRRLSRTQNEVNLLTYKADANETKEMLLSRAADDIIFQLQKTKAATTSGGFVGGERNSIMMLASISTMASWTELKSKLTSLPMVEKVNVLAISPQQVDMELHYRGTPESLENGITAQKLRLVKHVNYWVISRD